MTMKSISVPTQRVDGEELALAVLAGRFHREGPGLGASVPAEGVVERTVVVLKDEGNGVADALAVADGGELAAVAIQPVHDIALLSVPVADVDQRLILGRLGDILHVHAQELWMQQRLGAHRVLELALTNPALAH